MISQLTLGENSQFKKKIMFQICVPNQKVQGKKPRLHSWNFFKMQWLRHQNECKQDKVNNLITLSKLEQVDLK